MKTSSLHCMYHLPIGLVNSSLTILQLILRNPNRLLFLYIVYAYFLCVFSSDIQGHVLFYY